MKRKTLRERARTMAKRAHAGLVGLSFSERVTYEAACFNGILKGYCAAMRDRQGRGK